MGEGQFFERKSGYDRSGPHPKRRNAKDIISDIIDTLSAMANADGGEFVLGMEDDGTVTGVPRALTPTRAIEAGLHSRLFHGEGIGRGSRR